MNYFSELSEDAAVNSLSALDHLSLCRVQVTCSSLLVVARNQYVWQGLYMAERGRRITHSVPRDWISAFRGLRPAWDDPVFTTGASLRWKLLADDPDVPDMLGGQDPKLFDLGQARLLVLAGASYAAPRGGIQLSQASDAYLLDLTLLPRSNAWKAVGIDGERPPALHGSYGGATGDGIVANCLLMFAGGNHVSCHDVVSMLELGALPSNATWRRLQPVSSGPAPRYAGASAFWDGSLLILGGRTHGEFYGGEELWILRQPMQPTLHWDLVCPAGEGPSPRVWLTALVVGDNLVVYGGALWTFSPSCWGNDLPGTIWTCDLVGLTWFRNEPPHGTPAPHPRVGAITALCGRHLLVYGGCSLEDRSYFDDVWLYDFAPGGTWEELHVSNKGIARSRSHGIAILPSGRGSVPRRHSVIVFGGSQYFNGEYFRDMLTLEHEFL